MSITTQLYFLYIHRCIIIMFIDGHSFIYYILLIYTIIKLQIVNIIVEIMRDSWQGTLRGLLYCHGGTTTSTGSAPADSYPSQRATGFQSKCNTNSNQNCKLISKYKAKCMSSHHQMDLIFWLNPITVNHCRTRWHDEKGEADMMNGSMCCLMAFRLGQVTSSYHMTLLGTLLTKQHQ